MGVTFEALVTPGGIVVAAGIVTSFVQLLKTSFATLDARVSGALMAFLASAVLYVATGVALAAMGKITDPNAALNVFLAWLASATSSVGIKSAYDHIVSKQ